MPELTVAPVTGAVAVQEPEPVTLLAVIARAARDPDVDIDKMERLIALRERVEMRGAETEFNQAMSACQADTGRIAADATNPQTHSAYATYAKLDKVLRPIYTRHGFALSFDEEPGAREDYVRVVCIVSHRGGFSRTYRCEMPADGKGAKGGDVMTKTHAHGAAKSYGMRYLLRGIFNIAIGEEDRDGNAPPVKLISKKQAADLRALLEEVKADVPRFLSWAKVATLGEIPAASYSECVRIVEAKRHAAPRT